MNNNKSGIYACIQQRGQSNRDFKGRNTKGRLEIGRKPRYCSHILTFIELMENRKVGKFLFSQDMAQK